MTKQITYYADNGSMGDTPVQDCDAYRSWAANRLQQEYPDCEITVSSKPCLDTIRISDDLHEREREIQEFAKRLWDTCPWNW